MNRNLSLKKCGNCSQGNRQGHGVVFVKIINPLNNYPDKELYLHASRTGNATKIKCFVPGCDCLKPDLRGMKK